jgi:hypothetical protein
MGWACPSLKHIPIFPLSRHRLARLRRHGRRARPVDLRLLSGAPALDPIDALRYE